MKARSIFRLALLLGLAAGLFAMTGCGTKNPLAPQSSDQIVTADGKTLKFLVLGDTDPAALSKVVTSQKWINKSSGGSISIYYRKDYSDGNSPEVTATLSIPANSISQSCNVSMLIDDSQNVGPTDIVFGPHGTTFSNPAKLTVEGKHLNLTGFTPSKLKLYYVNPSGQWVQHKAYEIYIDASWGNVRIVNAVIPHFSRYAIASE